MGFYPFSSTPPNQHLMLSEKYVQHKALHFLKRRYRLRARSRILAKKEVSTLKKYGRKRADGLLIFKHLLWGSYIVSMEAKSQKTLAAIKPTIIKSSQRLHSIKAGLSLVLITGSLLTIYKLDDGFWQFLIPILLFILGYLAYSLLAQNSYRHQKAAVFKQLGQYPANEQWIAVSKDALKALPKKKRKALLFICRHQGVGLVVVNSLGFAFAKIRPGKKRYFRKYGKYYGI